MNTGKSKTKSVFIRAIRGRVVSVESVLGFQASG